MEGDCEFVDDVPSMACSHIPPSVVRQFAEARGIPVEALATSAYAEFLVLLGSMRALPYGLKAVLNERGPWAPFLDHSAGTTFTEWARLKSLPRLTATIDPGNHFNVIFNTLPHEPYFMGEDCVPRPTQLAVPEEEVERRGYASLFALQHAVGARCTLGIVADYLDWLKREQVYDNTTIVLVSDHGIVGPVEDRSTRAVAGGTTANIYVRTRPLLMVKRRHGRGALAVSEEFVPNAEVPRIVCEDIGGCVNPFLADRPVAPHGRDDPFLVAIVPWQFSEQRRDAFVMLAELMLRGRDPYRAQGWSDVRR
jgi:hypothetical protein